MFGQNQVSDKDLLKCVNKRLIRTGTGGQSKVMAAVRQGTVTLTGNLQYEIQRNAIVKAATSTAGVRRVVDQMQLAPKKTY